MVLLILHITGFIADLWFVIFVNVPLLQRENSFISWIFFGIEEALMVFFAVSLAFDVSRLWG